MMGRALTGMETASPEPVEGRIAALCIPGFDRLSPSGFL